MDHFDNTAAHIPAEEQEIPMPPSEERDPCVILGGDHHLYVPRNGAPRPSTKEAAIWWESLSLMEQAFIHAECATRPPGACLDGEGMIRYYRNPS